MPASSAERVLTVTRVYPQVTDGTFTVDLTFNGSEPSGLLPGQSLRGKLSLGADRTTTILPAGAFLERTGGDWIFVLTKDGSSAHGLSIEIDRRNGEQVEVPNGLVPGDRAVISDYTGLDRIDRIDLRQLLPASGRYWLGFSYKHCALERLACEGYSIFMAGEGEPRWRRAPMAPSRGRYEALMAR